MVPLTAARAFEQLAEDNGRTIASELRMAMDEWLRKHGRKT